MFDTKEQEIIKYGLSNGKTKDEITKAITNYRLGVSPKATTEEDPKKEEPGFFQRVWNKLSQKAEDITSQTKKALTPPEVVKNDAIETAKNIGERAIDIPEAALRFVGAVATLPFDVVAEVPGIKDTLEKVGEGISKIPGAEQLAQNLNKVAEKHPELAKDVQNVLDILAFKGGGWGAKKTAEQATKVVEAGTKIVQKAEQEIVERAPQMAEKFSGLIKPKPSAIEAAGQVVQGTTKDLKAGVKALSQLDVSDVNTFKDLGGKVKSRITELAKTVDADLAKDTGRRLLKDLTISGETNAGKIVKQDIVSKALDQLEELYTKIGDTVGSANIREARKIATKEGLTNLEINDLARVYGEEFGSKAFNKVGDALTSVNAQMYENTRKGLKGLARQGIKGSEAQVADKAMSNLYDFQRLVGKNIEAVNKLQQKIAKRGLLEKVGYNVVKYADILTGGTIRGVVGGLLPRGVGYKVMNALDIEKVLNRNLKIIQDAIQSGSDEEIVKILGKLSK